MTPKLAIIATHPIQYYAPWFAWLARGPLSLRVFYLWDSGVAEHFDKGFRRQVRWDVPLLEGYGYEFLRNRSPKAGTDHFFGLWNPDLLRRIADFRPSAVLLTSYNFASIAAFLLRWDAACAPLIFRGDSHRLVPRHGIRAAAKRKVLAQVFKRFAAVLYVGSANREYFILHDVPESRLFHSPHAVDILRFTASRPLAESDGADWKRSLGIPVRNRVVLFAGKFEEKKRPLDLLQAFVGAQLAGVSLLFVGSGPLEQRLRQSAGSHPGVFFAPFQNQSMMPRTYAAADLLVLPSFGPNETWGLAVNEAMCMGRPVVVSTHVGCAVDLVIPGETGLVFEAGDVQALRAALENAFGDPARLRCWGDNASRRIRAFSYEAATAGLMAALSSLGIYSAQGGA